MFSSEVNLLIYNHKKVDPPKAEIQATLIRCNTNRRSILNHITGRLHIIGFNDYERDEAKDVNHLSKCRNKIVFDIKMHNTKLVINLIYFNSDQEFFAFSC